jgi:hypothetical protein
LRGDVLAHLPGRDPVPLSKQFLQEFSVEQVYLPQVGLGGVARHPRAVFDGRPAVRVAHNTVARDELDLRHRVLRERVTALAVNSER